MKTSNKVKAILVERIEIQNYMRAKGREIFIDHDNNSNQFAKYENGDEKVETQGHKFIIMEINEDVFTQTPCRF